MKYPYPIPTKKESVEDIIERGYWNTTRKLAIQDMNLSEINEYEDRLNKRLISFGETQKRIEQQRTEILDNIFNEPDEAELAHQEMEQDLVEDLSPEEAEELGFENEK